MDKFNFTFLGLLILFFPHTQLAQEQTNMLPYDKIYAYGMDTNVKPIFDLLNVNGQTLSDEDRKFIEDFQNRFGGEEDLSVYSTSGDPQLDYLLATFRDYWRKSLLDIENNYMMDLGQQVIPFLIKNYPKFKSPAQRDSLGNYLADYIRTRGVYTTKQINPTGRLVDLLIWKEQMDTTFEVKLSRSETVQAKVVLTRDFLTLGWMEFATLGEHHPGGWTTDEALYCVVESYDMESENFKISYLAHEARHFQDKQKWPEMSDADLEYRAKLTELSLAKKSTHNLIEFFISNANGSSVNGHQLANHYLIQNLSNRLFDNQLVTDVSRWKRIKSKKINTIAGKLLSEHTAELNRAGKLAVSVIAE